LSQVVFRFFSYDFYVIIESCQMQFYILTYIKYYLIFKSDLCVNITWTHVGAPAFSGEAYDILQRSNSVFHDDVLIFTTSSPLLSGMCCQNILGFVIVTAFFLFFFPLFSLVLEPSPIYFKAAL
jgi:hypothetical protein